MHDARLKNNNSTKCGLPIKILSIISALISSTCTIAYCCYYQYVSFPFLFDTMLSLLLKLTPVILLLVYIEFFHKKREATVLVPLLFLFVLLDRLFPFINWRNIIYCITRIDFLVIILGSIIGLIFSLTGFNKKYLIVISASLYIVGNIIVVAYNLQSIVFSFQRGYYFAPIYSILNILARILFSVSLLIFGLNNKIPRIIKQKQNVEVADTEKELRLLADKFEIGVITEEEYKMQRAKIISEL